MAKSPSSELVKAYKLLKAGERNQAGRIVKDYLATNPNDADAWWLMAHAVSSSDNTKKCLERVVQLNPGHTKAQQRLAKLQAPEQSEPDDAFFSPPASSGRGPSTARAAPPTNNVSASLSPFSSPIEDIFGPSAPVENAAGTPFTQAPAGGAHGQPPGTGQQPDWGPGLEFVRERPSGDRAESLHANLPRPRGKGVSAPSVDDRPKPQAPSVETVIGIAVIAVAIVVLIGVGVYIANEKKWIHLWGLPPMGELDGKTFTLEYPEDWDARCSSDPSGYPVCGVANDERFNHVDWYTGRDVDLGQMFGSALSWGNIFGFEEWPDLMVSIIAMNVPESSPAYDGSSAAKVMYDIYTQYGWFDDEDWDLNYDRKEITVDGELAYYYRFTMEDNSGSLEQFMNLDGGNMALYDVYIPHEGLMFWMTISVYTYEGNKEIPDEIIEHMIESIKLEDLG
ncbi:MAG: hypothetical protein JXJ20_11665 [Anaerolineae bacterium]|nr:hypothetical protein [Anaerolineae bacterium]